MFDQQLMHLIMIEYLEETIKLTVESLKWDESLYLYSFQGIKTINFVNWKDDNTQNELQKRWLFIIRKCSSDEFG